MYIVKEIATKERRVWIEQHNEFFILKSKEPNKETEALNAITNLSIVLDMFDNLVGKKNLRMI